MLYLPVHGPGELGSKNPKFQDRSNRKSRKSGLKSWNRTSGLLNSEDVGISKMSPFMSAFANRALATCRNQSVRTLEQYASSFSIVENFFGR